VLIVEGNGIFATETKPLKPFHWNSIGYLRGQSARTHKLRHFRHFAGQELIIVWLEVRVLPAPPHSLVKTEISSLSANSPPTSGMRGADSTRVEM